MTEHASELARRLAGQAEAVCRHYLSNGRREGRYWLVGDVGNTPGRSMFVRLHGPEAAGRRRQMDRRRHRRAWRSARPDPRNLRPDDFARRSRRGATLPQPAAPEPERQQRNRRIGAGRIAGGGTAALRHVAADSRARSQKRICGSRHYGFARNRTLRFHPRCYYRPDRACADRDLAGDDRRRHRPRGTITGAHRTWLDPVAGDGKAPIDTPTTGDGRPARARRPVRCGARRHGGRRGHRDHAVAAMRHCPPCRWWPRSRPRISPPSCSPDAAPALHRARQRSGRRRRDGDLDRPGREAGIEAIALSPRWATSTRICALGLDALRAALRVQIVPEDVARFMALAATGTGGGSAAAPASAHRAAVLPSEPERTAPTAF